MSSHLTFTSTHLASHTRHLHSRFVGRVSFFPLFSVWMLRNASWQIPLKLSASSLKWAFSCMVLSTTSYTVRYVYQKDKKKSYLLTCLNQFIKKMKSLYLRYQYTPVLQFLSSMWLLFQSSLQVQPYSVPPLFDINKLAKTILRLWAFLIRGKKIKYVF